MKVIHHHWKSLLFLYDVELHWAYRVLSVISTNIAWYTQLGATFLAGFDRGWSIDLKSYDAEFDTTVILQTDFHENNKILISHQTSTNTTEKSFLQFM